MNKTQIIEAAFEVIKASTEWEMKGEAYKYWIDGIITVTDSLLDKINEENKNIVVSNWLYYRSYKKRIIDLCGGGINIHINGW